MLIELGTGWISGVMLIATRLACALGGAAFFGGFGIPARVRVFILLGIAVCFSAHLPMPERPADIGNLGLMMLNEAGNGLVSGFGLHCAFHTLSFAGRLIDVQAGFSMSSLFDPATGRQQPLMATAFNLFAVVSFFALDLHHTLMRGLNVWFDLVPVGTSLGSKVSPETLVTIMTGYLATSFGLGFAIAAPVVFTVFLVDLGMGLLSRNLPQLNTFVLAMPIKLMVALFSLGCLVPLMAPVLQRALSSFALMWSRIGTGLGG